MSKSLTITPANFSMLGLMLGLWMFFWSASAHSCPIPVYQYALEHWPADDYLAEVYLPETPSADESQAWQKLQQSTTKPEKSINLTIHRLKAAPATFSSERAWLVLRYPERARHRQPVWQGALNSKNIERILDSPFRQQLGKALVDRTSVVWILLHSGQREQDSKTKEMVQKNLERLLKEVDIPEQADWGGQMMELDYDVNFKLLSLRRDDPQEEIFLNMLLGSEADLRTEFLDRPLLFPVFGRGLLLYALVADGINSWTLSKAVGFLTGSCSCQVKAANPGLDLLLSIDWDRLVTPMTTPTAGGTVGAGEFLRAKEAEEAKESQHAIPAAAAGGPVSRYTKRHK